MARKNTAATETPAANENTGTELATVNQWKETPMGFQTGAPNIGEGWEQKGLPPIIKPSMIPLGAFIQGTITKIVESTVASIKNPLLYLDVIENGQKLAVAFPVTATIGSAFGVRPGEIAKMEALESFVGHDIIIKKIGQAPAKKGQKRGAHLFQVWLRAPSKSKGK